jgi:hypothetical protein
MTTNDAQILDEPHSLVGKDLEFQDEGKGQIVAETDDSIFILSRFFTGLLRDSHRQNRKLLTSSVRSGKHPWQKFMLK